MFCPYQFSCLWFHIGYLLVVLPFRPLFWSLLGEWFSFWSFESWSVLESSSSLSLSSSFHSENFKFTFLNKDVFWVTYFPFRMAVIIVPFLRVTLNGFGSKLVENLLCFFWQSKTVSPTWMTVSLSSSSFVSILFHLSFCLFIFGLDNGMFQLVTDSYCDSFCLRKLCSDWLIKE